MKWAIHLIQREIAYLKEISRLSDEWMAEVEIELESPVSQSSKKLFPYNDSGSKGSGERQ